VARVPPWRWARLLRPGIYWIRVEQHGRATTKKVVVVS